MTKLSDNTNDESYVEIRGNSLFDVMWHVSDIILTSVKKDIIWIKKRLTETGHLHTLHNRNMICF